MTPTTTSAPALTYRADPDLKAGLVREAMDHQAQDKLIRGTYIQLNGTWRGCAVGCTVAGRLTQEQLIDFAAEDTDTNWHALWAETTGCPEWLAHVEDNIFEGLPIEDARQWPVRFLTAIPVGVDLTAAREAWLRDLVFDTEHGALALAAAALESAGAAGDAARMAGVALAPDWSANLTEAAGRLREVPRTADWSSASAAAWSASDAASSASAAAWSASAAASSASAAASSASAAASSASAAASSDRDAAWQWIADRLIHHIQSAAVAS